MSAELKPCPFCGGGAEFSGPTGANTCWVQCKQCKTRGRLWDYGYQAENAWNNRFSTSSPQDSLSAPVQPDGSREAAMIVLERDGSGRPTVWCDPGVMDLVAALNGAGIATVWSCDGHGHRPAVVGLKDGRQLLVLESVEALQQLAHLWPDINGQWRAP